MFNLNTCPDISISHPSNWHLISIQVLKISSQLHPGPISNTPRPGDVHLNSTQVLCPCITFLLHTDHVSPQHMSWYLHPTSIQVQKITSQLHPSPISPYSGLMICTSTLSRSHFSPTQMSIFVFHLYPGNVKPWSRSQDLHLTSKEVPSHLHPGHRIRVSAPSRCHLTPIQLWKFATKLHLCSVPPHLHPGHISSQSRFKYLHITSIQVMSIVHPGLKMCVTHPSRSYLTHIQIPISFSHLHPCTVSLPPKSEISCLICIQVSGWASHLHPCPGSPPFSVL